MKKISAITLAILLISATTFAQKSAVKYNVGKFSGKMNETGKTTANSKAMKNFSEQFSGVTKVIWSEHEDNITRVYFETEGKCTRAGYNRKGQFLYSVTNYKEEMLPVDLWLMVKEKYYGKQIFCVSEVTALNKTAYLISLEDATSWLHIKILDDEITEEKVYLKGN